MSADCEHFVLTGTGGRVCCRRCGLSIDAIRAADSGQPTTETASDLRLHTVAYVAELLAISESTVRRLIGDGRLRSVKVGHSRRVPAAALAALMAGDDQPVIPADHWPPTAAIW